MGTHKGLLEYQGKTLLQRMFDLSPNPIYMAAAGDYFPDLVGPCKYLSDAFPNRIGPLSGILAGLEEAKSAGYQGIYVMACDTLLDPQAVIHLLDKAQTDSIWHTGIVYLKGNDKNYPLLSHWSIKQIPFLREYLEADQRKVQVYIGTQDHVSISLPEQWQALSNFNTPEAFEQAVKTSIENEYYTPR
ncbi:hypothetical protein IX83_05365 [Basilea psittacipulmonis DSM 24701]|uniref:MobA-like NTP transferase domain-containing protein n=2 Tax=Basilea TaxID=1472344 RepID=A0A077DH77_9BURK|nr:hypothetical protein IX83_05365 [Basilea psittacipulmonis DSM 24701]